MNQSPRVLAVDDAEEDVLLFQRELERAGFVPSVQRVENEAGLREALSKGSWDLVVSDFSLPEFDAFRALRVVKQVASQVPFIIVSGAIGEENAVAAMKAGAANCLRKDRPVQWLQAIRHELGGDSLPSPALLAPTPQSVPEEPDFRILFEAVPALFLVLTTEFKIAAVSNAYLAATKSARSEIIGRGMFDVFTDDPNDPESSGVRNLRRSLEEVVKTKAASTMAVQKYSIRRPDSEGGGFEERFWSPINLPVLGPGQEILYIIHRVEDVTEFVRLKQRERERSQLAEELEGRAEQMEAEVFFRAQEVQEANRKLSEANDELGRLYAKTRELEQLKSQFFANVSHELRTPLALIIGPAEKLLSADLEEGVRRSCEIIARNARTLAKHVNDLLDVAKLEAGQMKPAYTEVDLAGAVRLIAGHFDSLASEKRFAFNLQVPETLAAQVDLEKFQRVFLNLLTNAFKFTPDGGQIRCTLRGDVITGSVILEVADSGAGIRPELREAVFERFRQLQGGSTRRFGGTGLGLSIVREFVALHGGTVSIGDAPEGGALFTVKLPAHAPAGAAVGDSGNEPDCEALAQHEARTLLQPLREAAPAVPPAASQGKPLVLVVEDHPDMNQFIAECLAKDCRVESAFNGAQGLQKARELQPDLILSDFMMPEMSGEMLLEELRADSILQSIPVILLTAKADGESRVKLLRAGAQDYLVKPFSAEELCARVVNLATKKQAQDRNRLLAAELQGKNGELQRLMREMEVLNQDLEAFSFSIAHDLRTPLRAVNGLSSILMAKYAEQLPGRSRQLFEQVAASARQMGEMIDALLNFSRLGRQKLSRRPVDLAMIARDTWGTLSAELGGRIVHCQIEALPGCTGDAVLLRQVYANLLANAVKFTRHAAEAQIQAGYKEENGEAVYFVRDNGAGFDMAHAKRLFGVFQRVHSHQEFEGTGVGLSIVQRIVNRHGGRIWAEAKPGKGATFYFTLPS